MVPPPAPPLPLWVGGGVNGHSDHGEKQRSVLLDEEEGSERVTVMDVEFSTDGFIADTETALIKNAWTLAP